MSFFQLPSPIQRIQSPFLAKKGVALWLKRDDLIHSEVSGNKWRKLKYNLEEAKRRGQSKLLTFGGAYSNHIAATAAVGKLLQLETIGIIRGEEGFENKTLNEAQKNGMHLHFVSRAAYQQKATVTFQEKLHELFGAFYLVPEGGANDLGVRGCEEIVKEIEVPFDVLACSAGTGTTASGICRSLKEEQLLVFPALKGGGFILEEMQNYCTASQLEKVSLQVDYHFGGYGKTKPEQLQFMKAFHAEYGIELDRVYTSKMMFGLFDLIEKGYFKKGSKILAIHTGGLQGN